MLKTIFKWVHPKRFARFMHAFFLPRSQEKMVRLHCSVGPRGKHEKTATKVPGARSHTEVVLGMELCRTKICSMKRCNQLKQLGIATAGDLLHANATEIAENFSAKKRAVKTIRRYQRAIRVASSIPMMMPNDALLLFSVHRRHTQSLAMDSPSLLCRDLQRFSQSTSGRRQLKGGALPSVDRIKTWIDHCAKIESESYYHDVAG